MKQLRAALGVIFGFWVLLGVSGALYWFVGEWDARRRLPPEMRTPEVIHKLYDDAVCLECSLGGGMILVVSIVFGFGVLFIWMLIEVMHGLMSGRDGSKARLNGSAPPNNHLRCSCQVFFYFHAACLAA